MKELITQKILTIEEIQKTIDETENYKLLKVFKKEVNILKELIKKYKTEIESKKVIYMQTHEDKQKYYLEDGSVYVNGDKFKYLYNIKDGSVTYQFNNGQLERTFACGFKEIRYADGSIVIKMNDKTQEIIKD
ncbi:hypothetical protein CDIK_1795 [Cucumispora dikerogammari]|nr:hypothetical protein CDIK_1795 [Cucumispora dikerogammari]